MFRRFICIAGILAAIPAWSGAALASASSDAIALNNEGVAYYTTGRYDKAIEKFQAALDIYDQNPDIHNNLGYARLARGEYEAAAQSFKRTIELVHGNIDAHNNLGVAYYNLGRKDKALAEWRLMLNLDSGNDAALRNIRLAEGADTAVPPPWLRAYPQPATPRNEVISPTMTTLFNQGKSAYLQGDFTSAAATFEDILRIRPKSLFSHYYLGMSYARLGKRDPAMTHLREYLFFESWPPSCPECYDAARAAFASVSGIASAKGKPYGASIRAANLLEQGRKAYREGDYFRAVSLLKGVLELVPDSYEADYLLGQSYASLGDRERAVFHLTRCLLAGPKKRSLSEAQDIARTLKSLTGNATGEFPLPHIEFLPR